MTDEQIAAIRSELANDPLGRGYAAMVEVANDQALAAMLNAKDRPGRRLVNLWEVKLAAIEQGFWPNIKVAAASHPVPQIKAVADTVLDYVDDRRFSTIDMDRASTLTMLGALVTGSVITQEQADGLIAIAGQTSTGEPLQISRVEELGAIGDTITAEQVGGCR